MSHSQPSGTKQKITFALAQAQPIIQRYSGICNSACFDNVKRSILALSAAAKAIEVAEATLRPCPIDEDHWADATDMPWMIDLPRDRHELQGKLRDLGYQFERLAQALEVASDAHGKKKSKREVPESVYNAMTRELIALFEQTCAPLRVVHPDTREVDDSGESTQPSTFFIHQCLQQIDPDCDLAMARTCILNAKDSDKASNSGSPDP